jgi:nucleoside 2-deoxyribosyltransferase
VIDAIKDGAQKCGVSAERIDEDASNEPITKRMLESIDQAAFVIVDLSHPRPNVYYEAGYAQGLGKTPVYLARKGTAIPFDLKDYPVIMYPNMRELKNNLADRLAAIRSGRRK